MLISSSTFTTLKPGQVSSTNLSADEAGGFSREFTSARSAEYNQPDAARTSQFDGKPDIDTASSRNIPRTADDSPSSGVSAPNTSSSTRTPRSAQVPVLARQTLASGRSVGPLRAASSVIRESGSGDPDSRLRGGDERSQVQHSSQQSDAETILAAPTSTVPPIAELRTSPALSIGSSVKPGVQRKTGADPRVPDIADISTEALSSEVPEAADTTNPATLDGAVGGNTPWDGPAELAFAVKVQSARSVSLPGRISSTVSYVNREAPSAHSRSVAAEDSAPQVRTRGERSGKDSDKEQPSSENPDPKGVEKTGTSTAEAKLIASIPDAAAIQAASRSGAAATDLATEVKQTTPADAHDATRADEPGLPESPSTPQGRMKDISMNIEAADGPKVEIRIIQRAGDLQIAVKSADSVTTQGLRHGLSDLANRLNETGYHSETWRPGQPGSSEQTTDPKSSSDQSHQGNSQSDSGGAQQNQGQRNPNTPNRPRWIQELESNLGSGADQNRKPNGIFS